MNYLQTKAIEEIKSDVLFESQSCEMSEFIDIEGVRYRRKTDGTIEALETGKYEILITPLDDGVLEIQVVTDYGFCKASAYYGTVEIDGTINSSY